MQCFDTFRGFLHRPKRYAATMDGKGR